MSFVHRYFTLDKICGDGVGVAVILPSFIEKIIILHFFMLYIAHEPFHSIIDDIAKFLWQNILSFIFHFVFHVLEKKLEDCYEVDKILCVNFLVFFSPISIL